MSQTNINSILNSTALRESGFTYFYLIAILVSALIDALPPATIVALCLSMLGVLLGGYIKKVAEAKMKDILAKNAEKDEQILKLREEVADLRVIKSKLVGEIRQEVLKSVPPEPLPPIQKIE
jgi:hypothetical protein